jgi:hypothetical protein
MNQKVEDPIVLKVMSKFYERSQRGIDKYGTMLTRTDLDALEWLNHAQEEAMDFCLYLERLKDEYNKPFVDRLMEEMIKKENEQIDRLTKHL